MAINDQNINLLSATVVQKYHNFMIENINIIIFASAYIKSFYRSSSNNSVNLIKNGNKSLLMAKHL